MHRWGRHAFGEKGHSLSKNVTCSIRDGETDMNKVLELTWMIGADRGSTLVSLTLVSELVVPEW